jgi:dihydrofolate synthase/folylpolyglutamate synthase
MQMPRSVVAVEMVKEARLPYIVILTDPTTGGVSASFAMLGDIAIAEPGAVIGFAGQRVIQETIRQTLPDGFQRAEYLLEHGMVDMVVPRQELRSTLIRIISLIRQPFRAMESRADDAQGDTALPAAVPAPKKTDSDIVLQRLSRLHPKLIDLGLDRVRDLLGRLGNPERRLAPVVHIAGTNGKGSTIAYLRAMLEADGRRVQSYTSPHLVRFHERIRLGRGLIDEATLLALLERCEAANRGEHITYFEITTAAAFSAFAGDAADIVLLETGLGGRLDATNVIEQPLASVITPISIDHTQFLGDQLAQIAFEKAGILKAGVQAIVGPQPPEAMEAIETRAASLSAPLYRYGREWSCRQVDGALRFEDEDGTLTLPLPCLQGACQVENAGLASAVARRLGALAPSSGSLAEGLRTADWPGRMQRLQQGPLVRRLSYENDVAWELWLDGGHNEAAARMLAQTLADWRDRPIHLIYAMMNTKAAERFLAPLAPLTTSLTAVTIPGEENALGAEDAAASARRCGMKAATASSLDDALKRIVAQEAPGRVLICGSLYLAGHVLRRNG